MSVSCGERRFLFVLLTVLVLGGCARTRPLAPAEAHLPSAYPDHSALQIEHLVENATEAPRSLRARASLTIASPQRSGRFSAEVRQRERDSLYISISPGLGIEAVRMLATRDSVFVYDRLENRVTYGSIEDASDLLPIPIGGEALFRNVAGQMIPRVESDWRVVADSSLYFVSSPSGLERYVVDPSLWRVVRFERRSENGALLDERLFENFVEVAGYILPRRLIFRSPPDESTVVLTYREFEPDAAGLSFDLRVRDGARWTPVETR